MLANIGLHLISGHNSTITCSKQIQKLMIYMSPWGGRVVRWCWVNFQCRGVLHFDYSRARAYCACSRCGWGWFGHFFSHLSFSFLSPSLWETARYRLKYCLKGPLSPKQPTNQYMSPQISATKLNRFRCILLQLFNFKTRKGL